MDAHQGIIVRSLSGFYTVAEGAARYECRARGRLRLSEEGLLVGDRVCFEPQTDGTGRVLSVQPRRWALGRPAVANVDALVLLVSAAVPVTELWVIDQMTARCEAAGCPCLLVVSKTDLAPGELFSEVYSGLYPVYPVSASTGEGIESLRRALRGRICALAGNTGVGKSSLLNALCPTLRQPVGEVSAKLGRGRHTTRHVELFGIGEDTFLVDTPGFSSLEDGELFRPEPEALPALFPEMRAVTEPCRFDDCRHAAEPDCAVRRAVEDGRIRPERYRSYLRMLEAALERRSRAYK